MGKIVFITGTDTGVGKTVLTALLLCHLRERGCNALAMKPFCSGSRADARLLHGFQKNLLTLDEINPFFFSQAVAPVASAGPKKNIRLDLVLEKIHGVSRRCDVLLVEGIGGLLVPLQKNYTVADVISRLNCPVLVVGRNQLGTINHTLLTVKQLQSIGVEDIKIVLMEMKKPDRSALKNPKIIEKMAGCGPVFVIPNIFLGADLRGEMKINVTFLKKILARIAGGAIFITVRPT